VTLAVTGDAPPDADSPWQRQETLWVLRYTPAGPRDEIVNPAAFGPTMGWSVGWPVALRGEVLAVGALLGIVVLALALWRSKYAAVAASIVLVVATIGIVLWRQGLANAAMAGGDVVIASEPRWVQRDSWLYERGHRDAPNNVAWAGFTRPVFASAESLTAADLHLHIDTASGGASFDYSAHREQTVAFVRSIVQAGSAPATNASVKSSPMWELVKDEYSAQGQKMAGEEASAPSGRWPAVVISRSGK